jgi:hypothetical protein
MTAVGGEGRRRRRLRWRPVSASALVAEGGADEVLQQREKEGGVRCMKWRQNSAGVQRTPERQRRRWKLHAVVGKEKKWPGEGAQFL